jgi:hypothetical protein
MPDGVTCAAVIEVSFSEILGTSILTIYAWGLRLGDYLAQRSN